MPFSVLMSLYSKERPEYLRQSLESVFNQTLPPDEVILVEDGPLTYELYQILDEYALTHAKLKRVPLEKNMGLGYALNEGLKYCSFDIVARMDTDDICYLDRFEKQISIFNKNRDIHVVSSWISEFIDSTDNIVSIRRLPESACEIYEYGKKRCPVNHPSVMFRKNVVLGAGGYQPFPLLEDYCLWVRLLLNGIRFYNIQESLLYFRITHDTFRRRGGFKHAINESIFQYHIYKLGYISTARFIINFFIRFTTRIVPNPLRELIYKRLLR